MNLVNAMNHLQEAPLRNTRTRAAIDRLLYLTTSRDPYFVGSLAEQMRDEMTSFATFNFEEAVGMRAGCLRGTLAQTIAGGAQPEAGKTTVVDTAGEGRTWRRKASPKAVALLERFKNVPSIDPRRFRRDLDRVLDPSL